MGTRSNTRQKMLYSAVELLRERGAAGLTVDGILERSGAPRGSVYHHFPGGRAEIVSEALMLAGDAIGTMVERSATLGAMDGVRNFAAFWIEILVESDFEAGCPVVSLAVGGASDDKDLQPSITGIFARWHRALTTAMVNDGIDEPRSIRLSTMVIAAVEGAVILCRTHRSAAPIDEVIAELEVLITTAAPTSAQRE
ncbi:TetR/AcrR family transcriptional regulator [Rhodococcoides fascians]|uniref:TetR/AcrR family transcriptional regulator n=1 Tax=Rhodococcoides fascians TaxID=1828 RepID=UPI003211F255